MLISIRPVTFQGHISLRYAAPLIWPLEGRPLNAQANIEKISFDSQARSESDVVRSETLLAYLPAVPFHPFRIVLNSGRVYDGRHPEMIRVGQDSFVFYDADTPDAPNERFETVGLLLMERLEHVAPLPMVPPTGAA